MLSSKSKRKRKDEEEDGDDDDDDNDDSGGQVEEEEENDDDDDDGDIKQQVRSSNRKKHFTTTSDTTTKHHLTGLIVEEPKIFKKLQGKAKSRLLNAFKSTEVIQDIKSYAYDNGVSYSEYVGTIRDSMEDRIQIAKIIEPKKTYFFGVYDGHGGHQCAEYLTQELVNAIIKHESFDANVQKSLHESFESVDSKFCSSKVESGSTGTLGVIRVEEDSENGNGENIVKKGKLTLAHIGDSRAILVHHDGTVVECTKDHKANDPIEEARISAMKGGFVTQQFGVARVQGVLAVSRAFGDHFLKPYVIASPDFFEIELDPKIHNSLVIASDGLWDVCRNSDIATIVLESAHVPKETLLSTIISFADKRRTEDNVALICIDIPKFLASSNDNIPTVSELFINDNPNSTPIKTSSTMSRGLPRKKRIER